MERNSEVNAEAITRVKHIQTDKSPPSRYHHSLVAYQGDLFLFGGLGRQGVILNDLWHFSSGSKKWRQIKTKSAPTPRHSHQAVVLNRKMFVFGGVCEDKTTTNELYCFDFDKNTWELVKKLAVFRSGHSMVVLDKHIVIFGGADERQNASNNLFFIDSTTLSMTQCDYKNLPKPRQYASMIVLDGVIYLYGGQGYESLGDFYRIDANPASTSVTVDSLSIPSFIPILKGASMSISPLNNTQLILFGGLSDPPRNQSFTFSTVSSEWHEVDEFSNNANIITPRLHHQACTIDRTMYVFGGISHETKKELNDLWTFGDASNSEISIQDLPNEIWTSILGSLDGENMAAVSTVSKSFCELIISDAKLFNVLEGWISYCNISVPPIDNDRTIFIVAVGDTSVGKSASVVQLVQGIFVERYDPTIEDNYRMLLNKDSRQLIGDILDSADLLGEPNMASFRSEWLKKSHGVYAIYDVTRPETLTNLSAYIEKIRQIKQSGYPLIIVGNKTDLDLQRKVSQAQGQEFAKKHGALWAETTAKSHDDIDRAFDLLFQRICQIEKKQSKKETEKPNKSTKKDKCSVM
eukprot:TRINITY_DN2485_c0_g1_i1.p1 TRINITY_DN2485_c0_g1~~TRINITY_DN2485_c0_g1_i1.p1  ORF type:complete len:578 (+),score=56.26 TRINITY_DN2485_c0_g1_i1:33-1766(+)